MSVDMTKWCEIAKQNIHKRPAGQGRMSGKICIVTGAAQGFGKGIAEEMYKEGASIVIADLNEELAAENRDDLSFVWQAVKDLPEKYREAIHLFYYEGYSTKQIATILQRSEATVRSDLHRGRSMLRDILKEAYDFDEIR